MTTGAQVVEAAREWMGTPFRHQGRSKAGIDCVGLLILVGEKLGITDYEDKPNYPKRPDGTFMQRFRDNMVQVFPVTDMKNGDVLLFSQGLSMCHCGIMATVERQPGIIHAAAFHHCVTEETLSECEDECGKPRFVFRFTGVEG